MAHVLREPRGHPLYTMQRGTWQTPGDPSTCDPQGSGWRARSRLLCLAAKAAGLRLLMRRILLLWRIQLHLDGFRFVVDVEDLAKGLIPFGDHLHPNGSLRDGRNLRYAFLVGARFPCRQDLFAKLHFGAALHEFHNDAGTL